MKEATGEVSGVVVTIVIIALVLTIGTAIFAGDTVKNWIEGVFNNNIGGAAGENIDFG